MGWYTEKEGGQQMTQYDDFENAVTLYAQWSPDALTPVIADQPDDVDEQIINTEIFLPMTVLAPTDGGALSYQWYRCNEDGTEARPVEGATESTFVGMADALGTFYYYCVVTNTNKNVSGSKTASVRSDIARVTVAAPTGVEDAMEPQLNWEVMNDATYGKGAQVDDLLYYAFVNDGGVLTYQWYVSSDETSAGTAIDGAAQSTFMPPTEEAGTFYYYCVATNTNAYASNNQMAQSTSSRAKITVVDAQAPVIITQPASAAYREGDTAVPLTVEAEAGEGCILTYQWYENEYPNVEGGVAVAGADQNSFVPATQMEPDEDYMSMYYYFCEITAAYPDGKTLTLYSQVASITVIGSSSGEYIINFDPNGGSVSEISMTTVNQQLLSMPVPERIGYDFDGWYTEKEGGTHVTVSSRIYSGDETLYAHWIDNGLAGVCPISRHYGPAGKRSIFRGRSGEPPDGSGRRNGRRNPFLPVVPERRRQYDRRDQGGHKQSELHARYIRRGHLLLLLRDHQYKRRGVLPDRHGHNGCGVHKGNKSPFPYARSGCGQGGHLHRGRQQGLLHLRLRDGL